MEWKSFPIDLCKGSDFFVCLGFFFSKILQIILVLSLALSAIFIAWAGILYITQPEKTKDIHKRIIWAVFGLIVAFLSYALIKLIENALNKGTVLLFNFALAQQIPDIKIPETISCGNDVRLPSIFREAPLARDVWKTCFLFYATKLIKLLYFLSLSLGAIFLSWAGILYITQPEKTKDIHSKLYWGIAGVILAILSLTIIRLIERFFLS